MAIQIRRGDEADLDIARLKAGELAVCLDTGKFIVKLSGGNYLTLTDMPALRQIVEGKANLSDIPDVSAFITRLVNDLANYYTKSETYTQAEVNALVSAIPKFKIEVVQTLPTTNISATTVYLVPDTNVSSTNLYTEYIYVNNAWESLGTQTVDLSGCVTTADLNAALAGKQDTLIFDSTPTENSTNPVTSGGVFAALNSGGHMKVDLLLSGVSTATSTAKACNWAAYDVLLFAYGWYTNIRGSIVIPTSYFPNAATNHVQLFDPSSVSSTNIACRIIQIYPSGDNAVVLHSGNEGIKMWVWGVRLR